VSNYFHTTHESPEQDVSMSILASLKKGFSFFLMSMGVSTYAKKPKPAAPTVPPPAKPK
jgi:hypothetical protein